MNQNRGTGSIELVVLGLLAALIVVLAIPLIGGHPKSATEKSTPPTEVRSVEGLD